MSGVKCTTSESCNSPRQGLVNRAYHTILLRSDTRWVLYHESTSQVNTMCLFDDARRSQVLVPVIPRVLSFGNIAVSLRDRKTALWYIAGCWCVECCTLASLSWFPTGGWYPTGWRSALAAGCRYCRHARMPKVNGIFSGIYPLHGVYGRCAQAMWEIRVERGCQKAVFCDPLFGSLFIIHKVAFSVYDSFANRKRIFFMRFLLKNRKWGGRKGIITLGHPSMGWNCQKTTYWSWEDPCRIMNASMVFPEWTRI